MTEPDVHQDRRRADTTTAALTGSSPDVNAIFQGLVTKFIEMPGKIGGFFSWWLSNIWIIAAIGVPAMLAAAPLLDKVYQGRAAERSYQLDMFKLQTDVEIKKLDRTLLGEGAMGTLQKISEKLDQQANQTTKIQLDMARLADDVKAVQKAQASTDRRVGAIARSQRESNGGM
jgi:hypothetical protein